MWHGRARRGRAWHGEARQGKEQQTQWEKFSMHTAIAQLQSFGCYSQSKFIDVEKLPKERPDDYEKRTWRERMHVTEDGYVYIPPMAFKNCLSEAAKFLSIQIPGKGKATFTKHFEAGILVLDPLVLQVKAKDVDPEVLFVPSDGKRGGGRRVKKYFPYIPEWSGTVTFQIIDDTITKDAFKEHLDQAGQIIGIGRFRPRNNGYYGRFVVKTLKWQ